MDKVSQYMKREHITLESENARTTHLKYLCQLSGPFQGTGDEELYRKAEELKIYISHQPLST